MITFFLVAAALGLLISGRYINSAVRRAYKTPPLHQIWTGKPGKPIGKTLAEGVTKRGKYSNVALQKALRQANAAVKDLQRALEASQRREETLRRRLDQIKKQVGTIGLVDRISCTMEHCVYYNKALDRIEAKLADLAAGV